MYLDHKFGLLSYPWFPSENKLFHFGLLLCVDNFTTHVHYRKTFHLEFVKIKYHELAPTELTKNFNYCHNCTFRSIELKFII